MDAAGGGRAAPDLAATQVDGEEGARLGKRQLWLRAGRRRDSWWWEIDLLFPLQCEFVGSESDQGIKPMWFFIFQEESMRL